MRAAAAITSTATAIAVLIAGCDTHPDTAPDVGVPIAATATVELPDEPHHDDHHHGPTDGHTPPPLDADGPAAAAVALITDGLEHQGLNVIDVAVDTTQHSGERATVRVAATHTHRDRVHTSIYELILTRSHPGGWRLAEARTVQ